MKRPSCPCRHTPGVRCDDDHCDRGGHGQPFDIARHCRACWLWHNDPDHRRAWGGPPLPAAAAPIAPARLSYAASCMHLGGATGARRQCPSCAGNVEIKLRACSQHGVCTTHKAVAGVACCQGCADYRPPLEWISTAQLAADAVLLAAQMPAGTAGIAGIPRSGMLPAAILATILHLPLYQLGAGGLQQLGHGSRGTTSAFAGARGGHIAVVDDTVYGGHAMRQARTALRGQRAVYAAVYVRPESVGVVDLYQRLLPSPHLLEWNVANNGTAAGHAENPTYGCGLAMDLDGIIVHDADSGAAIGTPYLVPCSWPVPLIATGRPERDRAATVAQLQALGARYDRLEMLPNDVPLTVDSAAAHKAQHYLDSGAGYFLESDVAQAAEIFRLAGKPVICPRAARVWQ